MEAVDINRTMTFPSWYSPDTGVYRSTHLSVPLPTSPFLDVVSHIFSHSHAGSQAYVDCFSGFSISYSEFLPLVKSMASGLQKFGVMQGDVVLLLLPNSVYYPVVFLSVLYLGGVVTTMNPLSSPAEISSRRDHTGVRLAFTGPEMLRQVQKLGINAVAVPLTGPVEKDKFPDFYGLISNPVGAKLDIVAKTIIRQDDTAAIIYSSGTTGASKGVVLTHGNLIAMIELFVKFGASQYSLLSSEKVYLAVLPMFHIFGLSLFVLGLPALGSRVVVMSRYDPNGVVRAIERHQVTHFAVVPPIIKSLTKAAKYEGGSASLKSLKQVFCGAAPMDRASIEKFLQALPHVDFIQGYAMSESTAVGTGGFNSEKFQNYTSIGLMAPNMEAKVVDLKTGFCLPPGLSGELLLRGPAIMKGYLKNDEATKLTIDEDGWLHTGDIIHFDNNGFLYIHDRIKEIIKYNGFQIAPADLEAVLMTHPDIADAAVAGAPCEKSGEIPVAFVIRKSGRSSLSKKDVIEFVSKQVAPYKKVRKVMFIGSIPRTAAGKILRRQLKSLLVSSRL